MWVARYNGPANRADSMLPTVVRSVAVSADGTTVFVTGTSEGATSGADYATVAYSSATGAQRWVARYNGPGNGDDIAGAVAVSPDGATVFVSGGSTGNKSGLDYLTVAYNARTGAQQWVARYDGPAGHNEGVASLAVDPNGTKLFVTGTSEGATPGEEKSYATVAYAAASGTQLWADRYVGPAKRDSAYSVAVSRNGATVFVTGWSQVRIGGMAKDYATVAYNADTGARRWIARYAGSGNDNEGRSVTASADGARVFVTGSSQGATSGYATVAYNATTGTQLWVRTREAPPRTGATYTSAVTLSPDGKTLFAAGIGATVAYDAATGSQVWASPDSATFLAVSSDGTKVFAAGTGDNATTGSDYTTIAYFTSTGKQVWRARYNGPGHGDDSASGVAVSGDRVFVAGTSKGVRSGPDYATVAYIG